MKSNMCAVNQFDEFISSIFVCRIQMIKLKNSSMLYVNSPNYFTIQIFDLSDHFELITSLTLCMKAVYMIKSNNFEKLFRTN